MKFYVTGKLLNRVEEQEYTLLIGVSIRTVGRGYIKKDDWGSGWIYESDESFRSWCIIGYGFDPVHILDEEYRLLESDGIAYLSKERTAEIRKGVVSQLSLIAVNS